MDQVKNEADCYDHLTTNIKELGSQVTQILDFKTCFFVIILFFMISVIIVICYYRSYFEIHKLDLFFILICLECS